jgi:hypothetical protein
VELISPQKIRNGGEVGEKMQKSISLRNKDQKEKRKLQIINNCQVGIQMM